MRSLQNGEFNVWNTSRFLVGIKLVSPMYQQSKSALIATNDFKFWIGVNGYSNRHYQSDFSHSFDFHCLTNLLCRASLSCLLFRKRPIYASKSDRYIPLWWAKFELECLQIIFIYFNLKFKVTCKNFECSCIKTYFEDKV